MQLYQRVKKVALELAGSETKLAERLSIPQRKFNGYLNPTSEKNLWQHLDKVLEIFPQVSRDWLWHGQGDMLGTVAMPILGQAIQQGTVLGRQTAEAAVQGAGGHELENMYLRQRVLDLEARIASMQDALDSKDKMLEMYEALSAELVLKKDRVPKISQETAQAGGQHDVFTSRTGNAHTGTTAAPLQHGTEG